jgi:hypothetical protein
MQTQATNTRNLKALQAKPGTKPVASRDFGFGLFAVRPAAETKRNGRIALGSQ